MKLEDLLKKGMPFVDESDLEDSEVEMNDFTIPDAEYYSEILEEFIQMSNDDDRLIVEEQMMMESIDDSIPDYLLNDPEVVGYPDLEMQDAIYQWAVEGVNCWGKTILDVGCGRGDLIKFIPYCNQYIGVETKDSLCLVGNRKYDHFDNFEICQGNYLTMTFVNYDIGFVIGTLNSITAQDKWETFKEFFNKLYKEISDCCIFILNSGNSEEGFNDFPFNELFTELLTVSNIPFKIDYSKFEDIYKLTVYK